MRKALAMRIARFRRLLDTYGSDLGRWPPLLVQAAQRLVSTDPAAARELDIAPNTLSAQLLILSNAGLTKARRDGRSIIYAVNFDAMRDLLVYLTEDCCAEMNFGADNASVTLRDLEHCADAQESGSSAKRTMRSVVTGEGNGRSKFDQRASQKAVRARG